MPPFIQKYKTQLTMLYKYRIIIILICIPVFLDAQKNDDLPPVWYDSLRKHLTLDIPLKSDSSFIMQLPDRRAKHTFYINKIRPNLNKAVVVLDSLVEFDTKDSTIWRLSTLLDEYNVRYQVEFSYSNEYNRAVYHKKIGHPLGNELTEFTMIEYIEQTISLLDIKRKDISFFLDVLIGIDTTEFLFPKNSKSTVWQRHGRIDISRFIDYYFVHEDKYRKYLLQYTTNEKALRLLEYQMYHLVNLLRFYDLYHVENIDCAMVRRSISVRTSEEVIKALSAYNERWHQLPCIDAIIRDYYRDVQGE